MQHCNDKVGVKDLPPDVEDTEEIITKLRNNRAQMAYLLNYLKIRVNNWQKKFKSS